MKFKIDENLPRESATLLREAGFDADTTADELLTGSDDDVLFSHCQEEGRILVTLDLDFSNIQVYRPGTHYGIVVIRSKTQDKTTLLGLLNRMIVLLSAQTPSQALWIVESDRVRYRR